ncbi:hypothetical protein ACLEJW_20980 [Pseudomonas sp. SMSB3]|nr:MULTISPECIES: hypothetical protein [unclassified Pseudomonas]
MRNCVLLGAGLAAFGAGASPTRKPPVPTGFVLINGWVLPVEYFQDDKA